MKKLTGITIVLGLGLVFTLGAFQAIAGQKDVPLPADIKIVAPDPSVPQDQAAFSGKWYGVWNGNVLDHILVVEEIRANEVMVVYAYGTAPLWNIYQAQAVRLKGTFVKGDLVVELPRSQATATYHLKNNGTITATRETTHGGGHAQATMKRVE